MKTTLLFPGQGAQTVGMGRDIIDTWPHSVTLFDRAAEITGYDIRQLCLEGPAEKLNSTVFSQPAIFVISAVILEILRNNSKTFTKPNITAGLSMGEYSALYAAGIISFEDALVLVQKRGQAMQQAADASDGSMVSILGLDEQKVTELCRQAGTGQLLVPVNFNCPGQIVISGSSAACARAVDMAEQFGAVKAVPLAVAGAFHTEMMTPAAEQLRQAINGCEIAEPAETKVIANINAEYYQNRQQIRQGLVKQLVQPILWQKCMERLIADGIDCFYEIGPGRVLTGLMKRIDRKIKVTNISDAGSLKAVLR